MRRLIEFRRLAAAVALLVAAGGCTMKKQETPSLTGPSEMSTAVTLSASPDVLTQDGASQSQVSITVRGSNGQALSGVPLRAEITVGGAVSDFGSLSAKSLVTDSSGHASLVYTAPRSVSSVDNGTVVNIAVTPTSGDFGNDTARYVSIRLVPPGTVGLPQSPLIVDFTAPTPTIGENAVFTASVTTSTGADARNQVASYLWLFGDGGSASGETATHVYNTPGTYSVRLTITDVLGRSTTVAKAITVGQGQLPTATFVTSPSSPNVGQAVNFNASPSIASPGHTIVGYSWDFGDGSRGTGQTASHTYTQAGTYTVVLQVTDDAGRVGTSQQGVTVGTGRPTASFTFSPSSPTAGTSVQFNGATSQPASGRTIVSYTWSWGDGSANGSGPITSHSFASPGTYTVTLTVTDDLGNTGTATQSVTVS